jgi:hypothetical protein
LHFRDQLLPHHHSSQTTPPRRCAKPGSSRSPARHSRGPANGEPPPARKRAESQTSLPPDRRLGSRLLPREPHPRRTDHSRCECDPFTNSKWRSGLRHLLRLSLRLIGHEAEPKVSRATVMFSLQAHLVHGTRADSGGLGGGRSRRVFASTRPGHPQELTTEEGKPFSLPGSKNYLARLGDPFEAAGIENWMAHRSASLLGDECASRRHDRVRHRRRRRLARSQDGPAVHEGPAVRRAAPTADAAVVCSGKTRFLKVSYQLSQVSFPEIRRASRITQTATSINNDAGACWGGWIRTTDYLIQSQEPYRLATPQWST